MNAALDQIEQKELELLAKGYSQEQAIAAVKRARKWADSIARKGVAGTYDSIYLGLLPGALKDAELWLQKTIHSMVAP